MIVDYERAWVDLQEHVAGKSQHGRDGLLREMAQIAGRCRVVAGELPGLLRLYGVEVASAIAAEARAEPERFAGGLDSPGDAELAGHHGPGGHDGHSSNGASGAGNGRRRV